MTVFALCGLKGGVGKTACSVNLAWLAASRGAPTLLWDLDPQGASSFLLRIESRIDGGAKSLVREPGALASAIKGTDHAGLDLLPADPSLRELDLALARESHPERRVAPLFAALRRDYEHVFVDCAPGSSALLDCVLDEVDCALVPTIPTVLSLRTLARMLEQSKRGRARRRVLHFFCMVDRRRSLHREVIEWARRQELGFLEHEIPYASLVEQMSVRRSPLGAWADRAEPARAYEELLDEILARSAAPRTDIPKATRAALERFPRPASASATAPRTKNGVHAMDGPSEIEFKLSVASAAELAAVERAALGRGAGEVRSALQLNHFFDTSDARLRERGFAVRLREEGGRSFLTAKGPNESAAQGGALSVRPEVEAQIAGDEAQAILAGRVDALASLRRNVTGAAPLLDRLEELAGGRALVELGSFTNERRRVGPLRLANGAEIVLELDRTSFPGGRVDYELEAEVPSRDVDECRRALEALLREVGLPWRTTSSKAQRFFESLAAR